jgi:hypothetical protein
MESRRAHWDHIYAIKPENELSWYQENPAVSLELIRAAGTPKVAAIIDVGGGASRLVDALLAEGYRQSNMDRRRCYRMGTGP